MYHAKERGTTNDEATSAKAFGAPKTCFILASREATLSESYFILAPTVATTKKSCFALASRDATSPEGYHVSSVRNNRVSKYKQTKYYICIMSVNSISCKLAVAFALLVLFSQLSSAQLTEVDTIGYVPSWYDGALEYNLMIAASKGFSGEIDRLVKMGAKVNSYNDDGSTPLMVAVDYKHLETVKAILKHSPLLDEFTIYSETALMIAVKKNFFEIAEVLIRAGAKIDFADNRGATPLHYSALYGYAEMIDMLLYYNAPVDAKTNDGTSALHTAICIGNVEITDLLITNGANMEGIDNDGNTPFLIAASFGDTLIMDILYKYGVDIYSKNNRNHNALTLAIAFNHKETVAYLMQIGDKWNENSSPGYDPYKVAAKFGRHDIADVLIANNMPGSAKFSFDMAALSVYTRFTGRNIYSGFGLSLREPYLNAGITAGINTKLWQTRIMVEKSQDVYYQYFDKSSMVYAGLFKDFIIREKNNYRRILFSTSLSAGYTFGNKFKGTEIEPEKKVFVIPGVAIKSTSKLMSTFIGLDYMNLGYYKAGSIWMTIGFSGNFYFDNMNITQKKIRWN